MSAAAETTAIATTAEPIDEPIGFYLGLPVDGVNVMDALLARAAVQVSPSPGNLPGLYTTLQDAHGLLIAATVNQGLAVPDTEGSDDCQMDMHRAFATLCNMMNNMPPELKAAFVPIWSAHNKWVDRCIRDEEALQRQGHALQIGYTCERRGSLPANCPMCRQGFD